MPSTNPDVITTLPPPDPNQHPLNITELFAMINDGLASVISGPYTPYVISSEAPDPSDQDKA